MKRPIKLYKYKNPERLTKLYKYKHMERSIKLYNYKTRNALQNYTTCIHETQYIQHDFNIYQYILHDFNIYKYLQHNITKLHKYIQLA